MKKHGAEQVQVWRRSFDVPPPPIEDDSEFNPAKERSEMKSKLGRRRGVDGLTVVRGVTC